MEKCDYHLKPKDAPAAYYSWNQWEHIYDRIKNTVLFRHNRNEVDAEKPKKLRVLLRRIIIFSHAAGMEHAAKNKLFV